MIIEKIIDNIVEINSYLFRNCLVLLKTLWSSKTEVINQHFVKKKKKKKNQ